MENRKKILLIDDEETMSEIIVEMLEDNDYDVLYAQNAEKSIELVKEFGTEIGLIILDFNLAGIKGSDLIIKIINIQSKFNLIFISGNPENDNMKETKKIKNYYFLQKPFDFDQLLEFVERALSNEF